MNVSYTRRMMFCWLESSSRLQPKCVWRPDLSCVVMWLHSDSCWWEQSSAPSNPSAGWLWLWNCREPSICTSIISSATQTYEDRWDAWYWWYNNRKVSKDGLFGIRMCFSSTLCGSTQLQQFSFMLFCSVNTCKGVSRHVQCGFILSAGIYLPVRLTSCISTSYFNFITANIVLLTYCMYLKT